MYAQRKDMRNCGESVHSWCRSRLVKGAWWKQFCKKKNVTPKYCMWEESIQRKGHRLRSSQWTGPILDFNLSAVSVVSLFQVLQQVLSLCVRPSCLAIECLFICELSRVKAPIQTTTSAKHHSHHLLIWNVLYIFYHGQCWYYVLFIRYGCKEKIFGCALMESAS